MDPHDNICIAGSNPFITCFIYRVTVSVMIRGSALCRVISRRHMSSKVFASAKDAVADIPNGAKL